jgi:hypothetical protein
MAKRSEKKSFNWVYSGLVVLLALIIFQFVQISKLDSVKLKDEVSKVENKLTEESKQLRDEIKLVEQRLTDLPNSNNEKNSNSEFPWRWVVLFSIVSIILIVLIVWILFFLKEYIKRVVNESKRFENKFVLKNDDSNNLQPNFSPDKSNTNNIKNTIEGLLKDESFISAIDQKVNEKLMLSENAKRVIGDNDTTKLQITQYLKGKSGHAFSNTSDIPDGSFFKLTNEKDGTAEFEYCGTIEDARSQFNAIFDNVSDTEGSAQNAKIVKTVKRGKIKFVDEKWEVTEKTKIKFD